MRSNMMSMVLILAVTLMVLCGSLNSALAWTFTAPVTASNITSTTTVITWSTDVPAASQIKYGVYVAGQSYLIMLNQQASSPGLTNIHSVAIVGLVPNTIYKAAVVKDDGNLSIPITFTTLNVTALLTVNFSGSGSGSVYSSPAGINCLTNDGTSDCSESYYTGTVVTLMPVVGNSIFNGWSGACTNLSGDCSVSIDGAISLTANFIDDPSVKIEGSDTSFNTINSALDAINSEGVIVRARNKLFTENVIMDTPYDVMLKGGYSDYQFNTLDPINDTIIAGSLEIRSGTLSVERITVM